jgi:ParB family transcriptional regulator, chromosome partitioning protein
MSELITPVRKLQKKGLGRGLGSLLGDNSEAPQSKYATEAKPEATLPQEIRAPIQTQGSEAKKVSTPESDGPRVWKIGIEKLAPSAEQPRKTFDAEKLAELAASIKEKGVLIPILARRKTNGNFEIIAGERRWRASQIAGLQEVPVLLRESESKEALEIALIENIQRHDLNPIEEAEAYQFLSAKYGMTQQQIAEKVGKERATIANLMRLCSLTKDVKEMLRKNEIQLGRVSQKSIATKAFSAGA